MYQNENAKPEYIIVTSLSLHEETDLNVTSLLICCFAVLIMDVFTLIVSFLLEERQREYTNHWYSSVKIVLTLEYQ